MKTITLFLGANCNASCTYCHVAKNKEEGFISPSTLFYRYLTKQLKSSSALTIRFLGGEPTLYMDVIKKIVQFCTGYNVSYVVTTNGLLLNNKDVVTFFHDHNFYVTVSFDGIRGIRGYDDIFYKPEYRFNLQTIHSLGCSMTLSRENADLYKAAVEIGQIENNLRRLLPFRPHYVHATTSAVAKMSFSKTQAQEYVTSYITLVTLFIEEYKLGIFNVNIYPLFMILYESLQKKYKFPETRCFSSNYVQIDLEGNCHLCTYERSSANYLGTLENESMLFDKLGEILQSRRPECINCELYRHCGSYCLASVVPEIECYIRKHLLTWFINLLSTENIDFSSLSKQEYVKRTGGFYELYR